MSLFGTRWFPHHHEMYQMLGLDPNKHLPAEGFDVRQIQGVSFKCLPKTDQGRRSKHRLLMECPVCKVYLPFGRYVQHTKGRQHKEASGG